MTYVVSDVHGYRSPLLAALNAAGLVDEAGDWSGGDASLCLLGDLLDRGPDGIGTVEVAMRLPDQAAQAGGAVHTLLGNHEILALGVRKFGATEFGPPERRRSFAGSWLVNGGQGADQDHITDAHVEWLLDLPALRLDGDNLLTHSDTEEYLHWGDSVESINAAITAALHTDDIEQWWECWRRLTRRYAYLGDNGAAVADKVLSRLGGRRIVHGHSIIGDLRGIPSDQVTAPYSYADDKVLAVDGGMYDGGPCLVVQLDDPSGPLDV